MSEEAERRIDLAAKIAMLEERSISLQKQLDRIESINAQSVVHQEEMISEFTKSIQELGKSIDVKITESVTPLREQLNKYKLAIGWITGGCSAVVYVAFQFKDQILKWLS
jgi:hypothetical protein